MKKTIKVTVLIAVIGLMTACATVGNNFSSDLTWIRKGTTTQTQVKQLLGKPFSVGSSSGQPTWTYGLYRYRLFGGSRVKELKIYWQGNVIERYSYSSNFPQDVEAATTTN